MTTTWKAHLKAYLLKHPRVDYKTAQKRASKTYQKMKKDGMAKNKRKSFWGQQERIDSVQSFRQYLETHKERILQILTRSPGTFLLNFRMNCISNLPILFEDVLEPGAVFVDPSLDLHHLCQIFYGTFKPYFRYVTQRTLAKTL